MIAVLILVFAAVRPVRRAADFEARKVRALDQVGALRGAAVQRRADSGAWPTPSAAGRIPPEVLGAFPGDSTLAGDGYSIEWATLGFVTSTEEADTQVLPPEAIGMVDSLPPVLVETIDTAGMILVRSADPGILAALLEAYRGDGAFVRDSTWSLVVPPEVDSGP